RLLPQPAGHRDPQARGAGPAMNASKTRMEDGGWKMASDRLRHPPSSILHLRIDEPTIHPSEAPAATAEAPGLTSLAVLLTRHVLRDGELVILLLKPSLWFILLSSLRFAAIVLI